MNEEEFFDALEIAYHDDELLSVSWSNNPWLNVSCAYFVIGQYKISATSTNVTNCKNTIVYRIIN